MFLTEKKGGHRHLELMKIRLGFTNLLEVNPVGRKGGLVMFYNFGSNVKIVNSLISTPKL